MNDRLLQYERILFKNTLLDIVRPSQFNEPTAKDFRNLKPIRGVYGAYDYHSLKLEIGKESHTLKWDWNNESEEVKELSRQKAFDETIGMLQNSVDNSKLGDKEKSSALKRLHKVAVNGESVSNPLDFLGDLIEGEWSHAEKTGGKTFMGKVVKGITRKIMDTQNGLLYGSQQK